MWRAGGIVGKNRKYDRNWGIVKEQKIMRKLVRENGELWER